MSNNLEILIIGRNSGIIRILERLVNEREGWHGIATDNDKVALQLYSERTFDLVLFSSGITSEENYALRSHFHALNPSCILLQHYGGGSALLYNEIQFELDKRTMGKTMS